jgi:hypothetical protein
MNELRADAVRWLSALLTANYGRSSETYVYAAGRRAGLAPRDIHHARREPGVEPTHFLGSGPRQ